ncbi:MAG: CarD family transcriptional regulator, partial [Luteimonas sp.]
MTTPPHTAFNAPPLPKPGQQRAWWRAPASASALAWWITRAAEAHDGPLLVAARDNHAAHQLESDLRTVIGGDATLPVVHFPDWETLPYDQFSPHPDIVSQRLAALHRLPALKRGIVVVPVQTLLQRLPPLRYVIGNTFDVRVGQTLDLDAEKRRLESAGYRHVPQVLDPGDFAVRGGLLDVYPMGSDTPYRVELFDEAIDTIRAFDPESQRSLDKIDAVQLLPGREVPLDDDTRKRAMDVLRDRFDIDTRRSGLFQDLKAGLAPAGIEYYLPLFFDGTATLLDYLGDNALPVLGEGTSEAADHFWSQTAERYEQRRHDIERPLLPPDELYLPPDALRERLNRGQRIEVCGKEHPRRDESIALGDQMAPDVPIAAKDVIPAAALKSFLGSYAGRVLIVADTAGRREALLEILHAAELSPAVLPDFQSFIRNHDEKPSSAQPLFGHPREDAGPATWAVSDGQEKAGSLDDQPPAVVERPRLRGNDGQEHHSQFFITVAPFDNGFALDEPRVAILTERQLFPERAAQPRRRKRAGREPDAIIRDLGELSEGAPIVHEDHGVGRYRGLITLDAGGMAGEYLDIEYAKGDRLYVPVAQLHLINRYSGASPETAPLHSLGGEVWAKAKRKAAEKVRDVAAELLEIQAKRQARAGLALDVDRAMYEPFAATFPFEETPDQHSAIEAVIRDLGSSQPMDRVVCGDVGFGKTEVAVRAAFVAAAAGKQVAVLVPTTLLAEQHYRNFRDRFADWP